MVVTRKKRKCKLCKSPLLGREGKLFCSVKCKSSYNYRLRKATISATSNIDAILHRNRSILLEIMGKSAKELKISREQLDAKKFNFHYVTQYHLNSNNKMVNYIYDFSWSIFSDQEIYIRRVKGHSKIR